MSLILCLLSKSSLYFRDHVHIDDAVLPPLWSTIMCSNITVTLCMQDCPGVLCKDLSKHCHWLCSVLGKIPLRSDARCPNIVIGVCRENYAFKVHAKCVQTLPLQLEWNTTHRICAGIFFPRITLYTKV